MGHIANEEVLISKTKIPVLLTSLLITVEPVTREQSSDTYRPPIEASDEFISASSLKQAFAGQELGQFDALIVRTLPNELDKLSRKYAHGRPPAFFSVEAMEAIFEAGFQHLLVDLPSIDKMWDEGKLTCHHLFWNMVEGTNQLTESVRQEKTITEMIFVHEAIQDGVYLLNLQVADWEMDAASSRPVLFPQVQ